MFTQRLRPGDWVVFRKTKHSEHPGPRATNVAPAPNGDGYSYTVDKFWIVREVRADGSVLLQTRRGKQHVVPSGHACLRKASLLQRLFYRSRFTAIDADSGQDDSSPTRRDRPAA